MRIEEMLEKCEFRKKGVCCLETHKKRVEDFKRHHKDDQVEMEALPVNGNRNGTKSRAKRYDLSGITTGLAGVLVEGRRWVTQIKKKSGVVKNSWK